MSKICVISRKNLLIDNKPERLLTTLETHRVPFPIVELWPTRHADECVFFADLHQRYAILKGQNEPVLSIFGVSVKNRTFRVKRPQLKG